MSLDTLTYPEGNKFFRHDLVELSPEPLFFTPRANSVPAPETSPPQTRAELRASLETTGIGIHRAPRPRAREWLGSRANRLAAVVLGASIALLGTSSWLEASIDKQTTASIPFEEEFLDNITAQIIPGNTTHSATPAPPTPRPISPSKAPTAPSKPVAPGSNCNYMPSPQHKASETSAAKAKAIAKKMVIACFGVKQWPAADKLWEHESNWRPMARNPNGGACGIVQSLPCGKLLRAAGARSLGSTTVEEQMHWGITYVKERYGTPEAAWKHWRASVDINGRNVGNWY